MRKHLIPLLVLYVFYVVIFLAMKLPYLVNLALYPGYFLLLMGGLFLANLLTTKDT